MRVSIFMIFRLFGVVSTWSEKALADGKVTAAEGFELVTSLAEALGVRMEFDVSEYHTLLSESPLAGEKKKEV